MERTAVFWVLALLSAAVLFAPLRRGDLPGYDDALYAHIAKDILTTGDWLNIRSNGYPALEHPPLLPWTEAALFSIFGVSDTIARLPSAFCGWAVILLVYWVARRWLGDPLDAAIAMLVMATSFYFLKYAAHAMTDVPFTALFLCAIAAWSLAEDHPRWYLAAGLFTGLTLLTRGLMGFALPAIFVADYWIRRREAPLQLLAPACGLAFLPLGAWYAHVIAVHGRWFFTVHSAWLDREVFGALTPPWRRYTGVPEYAWMLLKSYWPWLPFLVVGIASVIRSRDRRLFLLLIWSAAVFLLCAAAKSRVLRYLLPAYPAFAVLSAIGIGGLIPRRHLQRGLAALIPAAAAGALVTALFLPARWHALEIRPIAAAETAAAPVNQRVAFYDAGQPRFDETNQLQWYGGRYLDILLTPAELQQEIRGHNAEVFVVDRATYAAYFAPLPGTRVVALSGHLICVRLPRS